MSRNAEEQTELQYRTDLRIYDLDNVSFEQLFNNKYKGRIIIRGREGRVI